MVSKSLVKDLCANQMLDNMINLSDHLPINIVLTLPSINFNTISVSNPETIVNSDKVQGQRLRWDRANLASYYSLSYTALQPILSNINNFVENLDKSSCRKSRKRRVLENS